MAGPRQGEHVVIGPAERDAKGRFRNPDGTPAGQQLRALWAWLKDGPGPAWVPPPPDPPQPPPPRDVPAGHAAFTFIGHASYAVRLADGVTVLFDPIFSERCSPFRWIGPKRARPPAWRPADFERVDVVCVSHAHWDHMDGPSLRELRDRFAPLVVTGLGNTANLRREGIEGCVELDWGQSHELPGGHRASFVPMRHFAARWGNDRAMTLWGGFALEVEGGGRILHCGDTAWGAHLEAIGGHFGGFDAAMIPIGAYEPEWFMQSVHITPEQALAAQRALGARTALAMHHGTFKLTREAINDPPKRLLAARGEQDFRVPGFGETVVLPLAQKP